MTPVTGPGAQAMWGLLILLLIGWLVGSWLNRRRSKEIALWLQAGLMQLGGQAHWRWVRGMTSGAQIAVEGAGRPFRRLELGYFLLTRELPLLWGIELLRGKRDLLMLRGDLREPPAFEAEVVPAHGDLHRRLTAQTDAAFHWHDGPAGLAIGVRGDDAVATPQPYGPFLESYGPHIRRLSVRRRQPHIVLFMDLTDLNTMPATALLTSLRRAVAS